LVDGVAERLRHFVDLGGREPQALVVEGLLVAAPLGVEQGFAPDLLVEDSPLIFLWSKSTPYSSPSGRGGQPGT